MIDQLLIALNYIEITNQIPTEFDVWLKKEWSENKKIVGQYNRQTLNPFVEYESSAVYSLATEYFIAAKEFDFAKEVHVLLLKQPPFEKVPTYSEIHFFDYILSKTANWIYMNTVETNYPLED